MIVSRARLRLLSGADALSTYTFNTGTARHTFCSVCGIKSFYTPRSHPEGVSVSARCLEPETVRAVRVTPFDGANWEAHREELAALSPLSPGGGPEAGHGR